LLSASGLAGAEPVARFPESPATSARAPAPPPTSPAPPAPPTSPGAPPGEQRVPPPEPYVPRPRIPSGAEELAARAERLERAERLTEAITAYSESIKLDPSRGETLLALAKLRLRLGDLSEAELLLSTAARHASVAAEALTLRARVRQMRGHAADATLDLARAAELAPDDPSRTEELSALYAARGAWLPALSLWRRAAAAPRGENDRRARLQVKALTLLAAELDPVNAGAARGYPWTRRALARIARGAR
jgi:tetratricopeptide (TPR) repeat protein